MRKSFLYLLVLMPVAFASFAQNATIKGKITAVDTDEPLFSVNIVTSENRGTSSDFEGKFSLEVPEGTVELKFTYLGYEDIIKTVEAKAGETQILNVSLSEMTTELDLIVVSTSKYARKIQKETISMEVLKPDLIINNNITSLSDAIEKVPGVTVIDGQASIRGGSGYAYGIGSRVIMVVDDQPLLTPDRSEIQWDFIPIENIEQVEIIKGASSVQYGSSALNGVVHVRTGYAKNEPETQVVSYAKFVGNPPEMKYKWWSRDTSYFDTPGGLGTYFSHKRKINRADLVIGGLFHTSQSHLQQEYNRKVRGNVKFRYRPEKVEGLSFGMNGNVMLRNKGFLFFWEDGDSLAYQGSPSVTLNHKYIYFHFDPFITYFDKKGFRHRLMSRYYYHRLVSSSSLPTAQYWSFDYQIQKKFLGFINFVSGATNNRFHVDDNALGLFKGNYGGIYAQSDVGWKNLTVATGARIEYYQIDDERKFTPPVFRLGMNYQFGKYNYIRSSIGQAFRVAGIAERYVDEEYGTIKILPNPDLKPEEGYTLEFGYKRSFKIKDWKAYFDAVTFWTEFDNMVEFFFNYYAGEGVGFKSLNVNEARIMGYEFTLNGDGKIGKFPMSVLLGYTYSYPVDLSSDSTLKTFSKFVKNSFKAFANPDQEILEGMLKYRFRHLVRADISSQYKNLSYGISAKYYSFMDRIDDYFLLENGPIKGIREYREARTKGDLIIDLRAGYSITDYIKLSFMVNNLLNRDYAIRAAKPDPPRNYTIQAKFNF